MAPPLSRLRLRAFQNDVRTVCYHFAAHPVAAGDTERHPADRPDKILRQINTRWGRGSPPVTTRLPLRKDRECMSVAMQYLAGAQAIEEPIPACQRNSGGSLTRRGERLDVSTMASRSAAPSRAPERSPWDDSALAQNGPHGQATEVGFCEPCRACDFASYVLARHRLPCANNWLTR
jgi:hypothetical protein